MDGVDWSVSGAGEDKGEDKPSTPQAVSGSAGVDDNASADDDAHSYAASVIYGYYC